LKVAYFAEGGGKFVMQFVSVPSFGGLPGAFWGSGLLMAISLSYTLINGFFSIVIVDVYQSIFMFVSCSNRVVY
jgi:SSS family solute:Na+ symporter